MQKIFFDWNRPLLRTAAEYLVDAFAKERKLDMSSVILTLPGSRASKRLEEILLEIVERKIQNGELDPDWYPPQMITVGRLPEMLYLLQKPFADNLTQLFAWVKALDEMQKDKPDVLARIMKNPPPFEDITNRLALARVFAKLHRELAAELLDFKGVSDKCAEKGLTDESDRWNALAEIQAKYLLTLDGQKLWDVQTSRIYAIDKKEPKTYKKNDELQAIVLIGTVDMNKAQKTILNYVSDKVIALTFAPKSYESLFDQYGCLISKKWKDVPIEIGEEQIQVVHSFENQATELTRWIAEKAAQISPQERFSEKIVLGVPSDGLIPAIEQKMRQAGAKTRAVSGISFQQTGEYKFLELLLQWTKSQRFSNFAALLRHPIIEDYLNKKLQNKSNENSDDEIFNKIFDGNYNENYDENYSENFDEDFGEIDFLANDPFANDSSEKEPGGKASGSQLFQLLTEADKYHVKYLPLRLSEEQPAPPGLQAAWDEIQILFQVFSQNESRSAIYWCEQIDTLLCTIDEKPNAKIRNVLQQIAEIPEKLARSFHALEFLELLLQELQSVRLAPPLDRDAVEILGWLELPMDDAPIMVITSLNDGIVPSSLTADLFLPDKIRTVLEIEDNDRRLARDAYALSVILGTKKRENLLLLAARRAGDGSPLLPSRLLFASNDLTTVSNRVLQFFKLEESSVPILFPGTLQPGGKEPTFEVPQARPLEKPVDTMNVTEFRDYLACPYRYYLKHRLKLNILSDSDEEMDARGFSNLMHETLQLFGECDKTYRDSTDPKLIAECLDTIFHELAKKYYGENPRAVIAIQFEQLRTRLHAFADYQAKWAQQGNRIRLTEFSLDSDQTGITLALKNGQQMKLRGRVDRIDINEATGEGFILDYKGFKATPQPIQPDKPSPDDDLQLPLYWYVVSNYLKSTPKQFSKLFEFRDIRQWNFGYFALPKDVSQIEICLADWSESDFGTAIKIAHEVAQNVRDEKFGRELLNKNRPRFTEIYSPICLDIY